MKKIFKQSILIIALVALAFVANKVSAGDPAVPPPCNPVINAPCLPSTNTTLPINVGGPLAQTKTGNLFVGTFQAAKDAQVTGKTFVGGLVAGNPVDPNFPQDNSTLSIGGAGKPTVNLLGNGSITMKDGGFYSSVFVNPGLNKVPAGTLQPVCADINGNIILCTTPPVVPPSSPKTISGTVTFTCSNTQATYPGAGANWREPIINIKLDNPISVPITMQLAYCTDGAGYWAKGCFDTSIILGGAPSGYVDEEGPGSSGIPANKRAIFSFTIPANTTNFTGPTPWYSDNYSKYPVGSYPSGHVFSCLSNGNRKPRLEVPDMAYLKLITPTPGWTLQFKGISHQTNPAFTKGFTVYQAP